MNFNKPLRPRWDAKTTLKFVRLYRERECLWNSKYRDYTNKDVKEAAYKEIADIMKVPGFGANDIRNKIRTLRSTYAQELKKIRLSKKYQKKQYVPQLKWFNEMHEFLWTNTQRYRAEQELNFNNVVATTTEDMDEGEDTSTEAEDALEVKDEPLSDTEFVEEHHDVKIEQADDIEEQYLTNNKNYDVKIPEIVNELFCSETSNASSSYVNSEHSSSWNLRDNIRKKDDDEFGIFGQNVAAQLRQLKLVNALEAQAKISALLTECRLKQLKDSGGH